MPSFARDFFLFSNNQTASTNEPHSHVIRGITVTLVSEQSTDLSKGHEVVSSSFRIVEYCLPKTELLKTEVVSSPEVISYRFKIVTYCLPQTELPN